LTFFPEGLSFRAKFSSWVKTNGIAHSYNPMPDVYGMAHELLVTTDKSEIEQPKATLKVNISAEKGFEFEGTPTLGKNVGNKAYFTVRFNERAVCLDCRNT
jgi:hypothetical protein